ncbi:MAG: hypothetical protein US83_C0010G0004 [Candidatus Falkowbacteria bacterium GW2011_GWC2_38_22]|uniref:Uncharacterized protein n=1 Tax=Candidatus Falkowbacteria bacterium GW2011_GWE1_38_31 TaxID=1618638 RepID=A0A0G0K498_9BACT|nr:MAG: hypothetical protein US73_C0005G0004 [Candidatus Falkowbacteria bacterium GW2011_GWF2_38_1205]KKQ60970.1 MAG: hypothetical protein US83_C0010G0004 [Candidatus Falkowbacteria bacterium GW2011_GWC2_38_22]KKQ63501.1 MAG: hypothetical protein US84_C0006G0104 [Candidatus Falkowbacteria bacterium GW2011_GWF1_38_22]KKQ65428.1 MAG: hypothetical protein US87_C0007G0004 [Candidatus Falkowbacteria bacterium GW2011_GWE2_38_254]KKQ70265.1 MAG: hypothetical protein US91_C0006G0104 [Candidatus Falkowb
MTELEANQCIDYLRSINKYNLPLEKALNSYGISKDTRYVSEDTYKNFCLFVYKTNIDNDKIIKNYKKYSNFENYINNKSDLTKFFIEREPQNDSPKKKTIKKYTTYSAHGHYQTNSSISAFLNYVAMLPAFILMMIMAGIAKIFTAFIELFKSENNK